MTQQELIKLQQQAADYWKQMQQHLITQTQPWEARGRHNPLNVGRARMGQNGMTNAPQQGMELRAHAMPSDADVTNYIKFTGGNPYEKQLAAIQASSPQAFGGPGGPGSSSVGSYQEKIAANNAPPAASGDLFQQMLAGQQAKLDEANAANEERYSEGKGEYTDLRTRNQDRAKNWGIAAQADIDQRMKDALLNSEASLAARGLAGSTIQDSFRLQTAKDTAREQQRVSEMRDSRASDYDTRDTGNLAGFIERREDTGPDSGQMLQLAMQYGLAQQQAAAQKASADALKAELQANRGTGGRGNLSIPGPRGGVMPMFMGGNPVQLAGAMLGGGMPMPQQVQQQQRTPVQPKAAKPKKGQRYVPQMTVANPDKKPVSFRPVPTLGPKVKALHPDLIKPRKKPVSFNSFADLWRAMTQ